MIVDVPLAAFLSLALAGAFIFLVFRGVRAQSCLLRSIFESMGEAVIGGVSVVRNITEHRRADKSRALVAALVETSRYGIITVGLDGTVLTWNKGAGTIFGYPAEETVGKSIQMVSPLERADEADELIARALRGEAPLEYETQRIRKDGTRVDVAVSLAPIVGADGKPFALSAIVSDITERKRMQEQLVRARDTALESARVKSEFMSNMSHELRTPLNGIIGALEMLRESPLGDEQTELARIADSSAHTLLAMVNDVMDLSRLTAGSLRARRTLLDPRAVVTDTVNSFAGDARRKGLKLALRIEDAVPAQLYGDPACLRQVLTSLVDNALKFTPAGEIEVRMVSDAESDSSARLRFEVRDTGIGIPSEAQRHLFEPFYLVDASSTREYGGKGLGLAISRALVGLMRGEIGVESEPGQGSLFHFIADFEKSGQQGQAKEEERAQVRLADRAKTGAAHWRPSAVMVIGDDSVGRPVFARQLERLGYRAKLVATVAEAIEEMPKQSHAAFFVDCDAQTDGCQAVEELRRAITDDTRTVLVAMAWSASRCPRERCLAAGADDRLDKPLKFEALAAVLSRHAGAPTPGGPRPKRSTG